MTVAENASLTGERPVLLLPRGKGVFLVECARGLEPVLHMTLHSTHMPPTSFTLVGNSGDSPAPLLRPSPATGHVAEILNASDPDLGYDAAKWPYQQPQQWT